MARCLAPGRGSLGPGRTASGRLVHAPDVEHAARGVVVRVALRQRDAAVDDDRAVPVAAAAVERRDELPARRLVDVEPAVRVVDVEQTAGDDRARAGDCRSARPSGDVRRAATTPAVAPLSAAISQMFLPLRHTAGAVKRSEPDGVETICSSCPLWGFVPRIRASERSRIFPSLPPCAIELRREVDGRRRAEIEVVGVQLRRVRRRVVAHQLRLRRRGRAPRRPSWCGRSTARCPSPREVCRCRGRRPRRRVPRSPSRSPDTSRDQMSTCRFEQSEFQTWSSRPFPAAITTTCPWYGGASPM